MSCENCDINKKLVVRLRKELDKAKCGNAYLSKEDSRLRQALNYKVMEVKIINEKLETQKNNQGIVKCQDCDEGSGRWLDSSHACTRICNTCNGTGKLLSPTHPTKGQGKQ